MTVTTSESVDQGLDPTKPLVVVSADTHIGPRLREELRPYCPQAHLAAFDEHVAELDAKKAESGGLMGFGGMKREGNWTVSRRNLETEGHFDVHARLRDLDKDGVAGEIVFHDSQNGEPLPFDRTSLFDRDNGSEPFEQMAVGRHIYNRWLADVCSVEPERHIGLVQLPIWDIDASVKELEWAREAGLRGINFPFTRGYMSSYNNPEWEPLFAAAEDLGMQLCHHGGGAPSVTGGPGATSILKLELASRSRYSPLSHLMFGGVFEQHPNLHLILTESVGPWWSHVMWELDSIYHHDGAEYPDFWKRVPRLPSEYAAEQVFIGASFLARFEAEDAIANGYARNVIWGSDYPHFEGTFQHGIEFEGEPVSRVAQRFTLAGLPPEPVADILGRNAIRAYGFDGPALEAVAERIGAPSFDDVSRPLDGLPDPHERGHHSFRTFGFWY